MTYSSAKSPTMLQLPLSCLPAYRLPARLPARLPICLRYGLSCYSRLESILIDSETDVWNYLLACLLTGLKMNE